MWRGKKIVTTYFMRDIIFVKGTFFRCSKKSFIVNSWLSLLIYNTHFIPITGIFNNNFTKLTFSLSINIFFFENHTTINNIVFIIGIKSLYIFSNHRIITLNNLSFHCIFLISIRNCSIVFSVPLMDYL